MFNWAAVAGAGVLPVLLILDLVAFVIVFPRNVLLPSPGLLIVELLVASASEDCLMLLLLLVLLVLLELLFSFEFPTTRLGPRNLKEIVFPCNDIDSTLTLNLVV